MRAWAWRRGHHHHHHHLHHHHHRLLRLSLAQIGSIRVRGANVLAGGMDLLLLIGSGQLGGVLCHQRSGHAATLVSARRQVSLVEETRKQHKVTEVHCDRQIYVALRDVARLCAVSLQEPIGPHIDRTTDDHLCQLQ